MTGRYVITEDAVDRLYEIEKRRFVAKIAQARALGLTEEADHYADQLKQSLIRWAAIEANTAKRRH